MGDGGPDDRGAHARPAVVSDASPLIGLAQIGRLGLLPDLFGVVLIPPAVGRQRWLIERPLARSIPPHVLTPALGAGETEAIALALEVGVRAVIVDERAGRRLAARVGLDVVGTVGILLRAKRRGRLAAVRPELDALLDAGFFVATNLYRDALARAGEGE